MWVVLWGLGTLVLSIPSRPVWPFTLPWGFTPVIHCFWPLGRLCNTRVRCNIPFIMVKITDKSVCRDAWALSLLNPSSEAVVIQRRVRGEILFTPPTRAKRLETLVKTHTDTDTLSRTHTHTDTPHTQTFNIYSGRDFFSPFPPLCFTCIFPVAIVASKL